MFKNAPAQHSLPLSPRYTQSHQWKGTTTSNLHDYSLSVRKNRQRIIPESLCVRKNEPSHNRYQHNIPAHGHPAHTHQPTTHSPYKSLSIQAALNTSRSQYRSLSIQVALNTSRSQYKSLWIQKTVNTSRSQYKSLSIHVLNHLSVQVGDEHVLTSAVNTSRGLVLRKSLSTSKNCSHSLWCD